MLKCRLHFEKSGPAKYISHLDLMQVFRRSFARAKIPVSFTEGFNPHPYLSIAMPLPTCFESVCELLDFDLEIDRIPQTFLYDLNKALPIGITAVSVFQRLRAPKFIEYVSYEISAYGKFDSDAVLKLLEGKGVMIMKRSKSGESEVDVTDYLRGIKVNPTKDGILIEALMTTGNMNMNPEYIIKAIEKYLPESELNYATYKRAEVYDKDLKPFRS